MVRAKNYETVPKFVMPRILYALHFQTHCIREIRDILSYAHPLT